MRAHVLGMALVGALIATGAEAGETGAETGLALPRYVSLKASKVNVRRGPGRAHRVDWVFVQRGVPVEIIAEHGHWRKVRDADQATGWVHYSMLRGARMAMVISEPALLREDPATDASINARAETGVIGALEECADRWCLLKAGGHEGWIEKSHLWGVRPDERFD